MIKPRTRGQPILALVLIMAGWIGARGYAWERAMSEATDGPTLTGMPAAPLAQPQLRTGGASAAASLHVTMAPAAPASAPFLAPLPDPAPSLPLLPPPVLPLIAPPPQMAPLAPVPLPDMPAAPAAPQSDTMRRMQAAAGHQSLWMAATALMPLSLPGLRPSPPPAPVVPARRWSGDGWVLLRRNSAGLVTPGPLPGTYGASQVGAVIRYRLDTTSANKPSAYVRGAAALGSIHQQEAAFGLSARPLGGVPLVAMAEARVTRNGSAVRVRPAIALVTELPPQALPLGFTGEAYAQGGYVGGRASTAFIDGLARVERPVASAGHGWSLKAGAGAWAAGQRGASRVDVGPVASVTVRLTDTASARVEADWRFRVRGRAKPDSGPALTISAGF